MFSSVELTSLLGWCSVINTGLLIFSAVMLMLFKTFVINTHSRLMGVSAEDLPGYYFEYLGRFKLLVIVFNIVRWVSLKIMGL